jgi:hypothetical protein
MIPLKALNSAKGIIEPNTNQSDHKIMLNTIVKPYMILLSRKLSPVVTAVDWLTWMSTLTKETD